MKTPIEIYQQLLIMKTSLSQGLPKLENLDEKKNNPKEICKNRTLDFKSCRPFRILIFIDFSSQDRASRAKARGSDVHPC